MCQACGNMFDLTPPLADAEEFKLKYNDLKV